MPKRTEEQPQEQVAEVKKPSTKRAPAKKEEANEFEQAVADKGTVVKKSAIIRKCEKFLESIKHLDKVEEIAEKVIETGEGEAKEKLNVVFVSFKGGKEDIKEVQYQFMTVPETTFATGDFFTEILDADQLWCFYERK